MVTTQSSGLRQQGRFSACLQQQSEGSRQLSARFCVVCGFVLGCKRPRWGSAFAVHFGTFDAHGCMLRRNEHRRSASVKLCCLPVPGSGAATAIESMAAAVQSPFIVFQEPLLRKVLVGLRCFPLLGTVRNQSVRMLMPKVIL